MKYDTYDSAKSCQPEKNELIKFEGNMENVWNTIVPRHEKVKLFSKELDKFRSLLKTMTEPVKVQIHQQAETVKPSYETSTPENATNETDGTIVQSLAKANFKKGSILLKSLKMHPDKLCGMKKEKYFIKKNISMDQK